MRMRIFAASAAALLSLAATAVGRAEPLLTSGIGLSNCAKLEPDLKPGAGLSHLPNALMFYWTQGYLSAANFLLLKKYHDYVDVGAVTEPVITKLVVEFCKANPDKAPISAIDKFIRETAKIPAKETDAFDLWEHKSAAASTPGGEKPPATSEKPPATSNVSAAAATPDDIKWINQCVADNKDEGAKAEVVLKYCTCMNNKMDNSDSQSITEWEKTHEAERQACNREAGWK